MSHLLKMMVEFEKNIQLLQAVAHYVVSTLSHAEYSSWWCWY